MNSSASPLPRNWLVFRLGRLGDVTLSTGVLEYLAGSRGWNFAFVTKKPWADIFANSPCVSEIVPLNEKDLHAAAFFSLCRRLSEKYQGWGLLDLHGTPRSRLLSLLWKGPVRRYPKMALERRLFLASSGKLFDKALAVCNMPQRYAMAVENPPPPAAALLPRIHLTDQESALAKERLGGLFSADVAPVALHPFAANELKAWPMKHWQQLAVLLDEKSIPWIALGAGGASASPFAGRKEDFTNTSTLRESCALLSRCRALVTGDSGPMHLASAVGTPVVALFGPTTKEWGFYPAGPCDSVLETSLPCRPCSLHGKNTCPRNGECLKTIAPENVLQAIEHAALTR